ncbi:het-E-1 heterokaryon incompatibility protein [Apiospora kogelbergensis]|uniref:Het-E-1 heterokaryon incompatibility protein n=1 Tax=Apiospora kogelbergensis TaxID=1337665 RepID=A0AAW0Q835_9PEZI
MATVPESLSGCDACQGIWNVLANPTFPGTVNLGPRTDAFSTSCAAHRPLVDYFAATLRSNNLWKSPKAYDIGVQNRKARSRYGPCIMEFNPNGGMLVPLRLVHPEDRPDHPGTTRALDPAWVNLDLLKRWKDDCLSSHGARCESPTQILLVRPAWLIDVERQCLVPGSAADTPYLALSYLYDGYVRTRMNVLTPGVDPIVVYGTKVAPHVDSKTLLALQQDGALERPEYLKYVAPIVKHSMGVTLAMGERYLWVDSLCIPHSDPAGAREQLMQMAMIYGNAVVTIVAVDDDAQKGLPGLKGISEARELKQELIPFGEERLVVDKSDVFNFPSPRLRSSPDVDRYYHRGWTYQEWLVSPRKIYFQTDGLHWECSCCLYHENKVRSTAPERHEYARPNMSSLLAGFPDLAELGRVIFVYNNRQFRFEEDALPAVSGLLTVLSHTFTGGFLYGLPEMLFERGLGWKPWTSRENLRRRTPSGRGDGEQGPSPWESMSALPSWSWVGWEGPITMGDGEAARIDSRHFKIEETLPITKWYTARFPDSDATQRREICSTWFRDRESRKDFSRPLPPGWTRHALPESPWTEQQRKDLLHLLPPPESDAEGSRSDDLKFLYPDGCGEYIFRHEAMPEADPDGYRPDQGWYYPFPVPEASPAAALVEAMPEQTPYLFCDTTRAWLRGFRTNNNNEVALHRNGLGAKVGKLYLHNRSYLGAFPTGPVEVEDGVNAEDAGLRVELVAIYKSRVYKRPWAGNRISFTLPVRRSERYTVLWVEWKEGVAYRLASGYVEAEAWDTIEPEKVPLVLG